MADTISDSARWVWAKSGRDIYDRSQVDRWLPLDQHLEDTANVADRLWDEWVAPSIKRRLQQDIGSETQAKALLVFLAGVHDVGKATPAFAIQVPELAETMRHHGRLPMKQRYDDRARLPHGLAGHVILRRFLKAQGWSSLAHKDALGCVISGYHGVAPERTQLLHAVEYSKHLLGEESIWSEVQDLFVATAVDRSGLDLESLRERTLSQSTQVLLTGLVIMADWIASNEWLFPLENRGHRSIESPARVSRAWALLSLPQPWCPRDDTLSSPDDLLSARFSPRDSTEKWHARPIQVAAVEAARTCDTPGFIIIEALMGDGKTEAALLAAEILAARTGASGCLVALPTQATTNAMFRRVLSWLERVSDAEVSAEAGEELKHAISLSHSKAHLEPYFRSLDVSGAHSASASHSDWSDMGIDEANSPGGRGSASNSVFIHHWMRDRKKSPLAEFIVATIDQVLFSALQARHLALRHLGLAGKVVVIDEVHTQAGMIPGDDSWRTQPPGVPCASGDDPRIANALLMPERRRISISSQEGCQPQPRIRISMIRSASQSRGHTSSQSSISTCGTSLA